MWVFWVSPATQDCSGWAQQGEGIRASAGWRRDVGSEAKSGILLGAWSNTGSINHHRLSLGLSQNICLQKGWARYKDQWPEVTTSTWNVWDSISPPAALIAVSRYNKTPRAVRWPKLITRISPHLNSCRNEKGMAEPAPGCAAFSRWPSPYYPRWWCQWFLAHGVPLGESPHQKITPLPFTRGYLGFLPLSTKQLVGSNPKAFWCSFKYTLYTEL